LIVDDDVGSVRLLALIVQGFGDVRFATHGEQAVDMVRDQRPDLVLLDAEMPGLDGFAVCRIIKSTPGFEDLPILFVTAHADVEIETKALELGAVDFITKPINPAVVKARVRTHLILKQRTDELNRLAAVDGLTGIPNRRAFDVTLDREWRRACRSQSPLSLLMIDVDEFKGYNDQYGHQAGDDCLKAVGRTLTETVRRPGELVARYGGEEFAVVLPDSDQKTALDLAGKLREAIAALNIPHSGSTAAPYVTISIGAATVSPEDMPPGWGKGSRETQRSGAERGPPDVSMLMAAADQALYDAKRTGRNRVSARSFSKNTMAQAYALADA
jgi:diguanylate cyclase (GGDEF)-like protein